jgi:hypothetical protein
MAGTVTITEGRGSPEMRRVLLAWVSSTGGAADATTVGRYWGLLVGIEIRNGTGSLKPTTGYTITITDGDGRDVILGRGVGVDSDLQRIWISAAELLGGVPLFDTTLTITVSGAGSENSGDVFLYII